jgi:hypothetical protein
MPKNATKTALIIEEAILLCALVTTIILSTWNIDNSVFLFIYIIGGFGAVISLLIADAIEQSRINLRIPESSESRHKLYFILGLANVGIFLYLIAAFTQLEYIIGNFYLRIIILIVNYFIIMFGIYIYYYYLKTQWKDDFEKLKEDIYSLRYRAPGEIIGAAFRVDPFIEKDVSGILLWIAGTNQIVFNVVGIILSGCAVTFFFTILIGTFSIVYLCTSLLFLSILFVFGYRIMNLIRRGPSIVRTKFVASKKTLADLEIVLSNKHKFMKSGPLVELYEKGDKPESQNLEFRNNDNGIRLSFNDLKLITDSNKKNKHMTGTIILFRPTNTEESVLKNIIQDIETSFPVKRRKLNVLLY